MIGKLNDEELYALLETLPIEFSVLDKDDKVLAWNKHETRIFKRPIAAIGRNVRNCHPQKSLAKVEKIISEMKSGKRDKAEFWIDLPIGEKKEKHKILIRYFAIRNKEKEYLGCLEVTQDIHDIQKIQGEKRLLD
ncbi:MAG: PAS domain-containing protein [Candidatus Thermoplasmatota archaeon]|jgi:PAS domain S-box-containing protein|nr:PAS domain-containing protein [Candidatus Thermoplasmatota archaeon]